MTTLGDYVARIEEACGEEKDFIVMFKYDFKDEAIKKILSKAEKEKSVSNIIFDLSLGDVSFRLYSTGKAVFQNLKDKDQLHQVLSRLLLP